VIELQTAQPSAPSALRPASPGHRRLLRAALAAGILGGPLAFDLGGILSPSIHDTGGASIAANAAANPAGNAIHLAAFAVASFLLPIGAIGLGWLAYRGAPRLASIGGLLAVLGWLPFSALAAQDDLTRVMATVPDSGSYAGLLDRFGTDPMMSGYLLVYIVGHLVAYVLLGVALRRARVIPRWAAWAMVSSSPLTIAAFVLPGRPIAVGYAALTLLVIGSLPAARAALR
jgi:hypothetical protein